MDMVYLNGSEQVQRAGSAMREAAQEMERAASSIVAAVETQRRFMEEWLRQFEVILREKP